VLVSKYADHAPLYRQEPMFERAGLAIPRSTLGAWVGVCGVRLAPLAEALREAILGRAVLHADETPVQMLKPGNGKTHRAYLWTYGTTQHDALRAVVYDFAEGRGGRHAKDFLAEWRGTLVCDDYAGYKALFESGVVTEAGCMAHARRRFHELWANHKSTLAEEALQWFGALYDVERLAADLDADGRRRLRELRSRPIADTLHELSRAGINRPGGVGIYRPGRRLPRSVPRGLRSVGHFAADFGARSGIFFGAGPTFGSR